MTAPLRFPFAAAAGLDGPVLAARSTTVDFMDELGERRLALDAGGTQLEVLHFRREFADSPVFEAALRARVEEVRHLSHPSLATVQSVDRGDATGLALVSRPVAGRRLSQMSHDDWGPAFAVNAVRTITPVLVMLHGAGFAHGTLSPDRVVGDPEGGLVVVEHVLAPAIAALELSRQDLMTLDLVVPDEIFPVPFTPRGDMVQLGFLTLSLLLGRRIDATEYPSAMPALLDEFAAGTGSPLLSIKMRSWLERALQIDARPFNSAQEAFDAFDVLPNEIDIQRAESKRAWLAFPSEPEPGAISEAPKMRPVAIAAAPAQPVVADPVARMPVAESVKADPPTRPAEAPAKPGGADAPVKPVITKSPPKAVVPPLPLVAAAVRAQVNRYGRATTWVIGVLAALAAVEAMGIWVLTQRQPPPGVARTETPGVAPAANTAALAEPPQTNPTTGPSEPAAPRPNAATKPPASISVQPLAPTTPPIDARAAAKTAAISGPVTAPRSAPVTRTGKLTISSPVELQVFMDGQLLGSSAAPLTVSEGAHQFEFVNAALDFRLARGVDVKRGLENLVEVPFPTGRLNINATPWAEVLIDGRAAGETPLANVTLPVGVHEIVFRHPELGERRQTVVVKTGPVLRVTQTFQIPLDLIAGGKR